MDNYGPLFNRWASLLVRNPPAMQETLVRFLGWEDPLENGTATHSRILRLPLWLSWQRILCNVGDLGSVPGLGRSPGEGNGYPLQYSGQENSMDCIVHGVTKCRTQLSNFHYSIVAVDEWMREEEER